MIHSLSQSHFKRMMPNTVAYLEYLKKQNKLPETHVFEFTKYHAPTESNLLNQIAFFSGFSDLSNFFEGNKHKKLDNKENQWLWDYYQQSGYVTMFSEEHCNILESLRHFIDDPRIIDERFTDLYCQFASDPFFGSVPQNSRFHFHVFDDLDEDDNLGSGNQDHARKQEHLNIQDGWKPGASCIGNQYIHSFLFDFIFQFLESYSVPLFIPAIFMEAFEPTMTRIKTLDLSLVHFLKKLQNHKYFGNTAVLITSDQGMSFSNFAKTSLGKYEKREPFLYLLVPPAVTIHHPQLKHYLFTNQNQLVSTFDVYSTLRRLPTFKIPSFYNPKNHSLAIDPHYYPLDVTFSSSFSYKKKDSFIPSHSISLVDEIAPEGRTCHDAKIASNMCRCNNSFSIADEMLIPLISFVLVALFALAWWFYAWCANR